MRRLYLQIYLGFLAVLLIVFVAATLSWWLGRQWDPAAPLWSGAAVLAAERLPADARNATLQAELRRLGELLDLRLALYASDGRPVASHGAGLPARAPARSASGWVGGGSGAPAFALRLPDGRWLLASRGHRHGLRWLAALVVLLGGVALVAYPLARRLTRRLERLSAAVEELGAGQLSARVAVDGRDEIAALAERFNRAAARIEGLVGAQQRALAGASHELRTPLTRLQVQVELLGERLSARERDNLLQDVVELDQLVDELLLASRLEAGVAEAERAVVDLLAIAAEEAARVGARLEGAPVSLSGDARLLRRMMRNLFVNAQRYGGGSIEVRLRGEPDGVRLSVCDRGPGVAAEERDRVFEPFYRSARVRAGGAGGVGLGLSLVRQIAREHGGDAVCLPREGGGACFEVRLPVSP